MQDLTLVGLTEDKSSLLLVSNSGEKYTLPADDRLREALRGIDARPGHMENQMDSALRPRDIQARIRAGESPETVAQAAQSTVDRIMRYASPVLAERAHIAERAQRASVRRSKGSEGPARILGEVVTERLRSENVDPETVAWDSWRREDGRWTLVADVKVADDRRHAEFIFDVQGRYVVAEDEQARWLVGEQTITAQPRHGATPSGRRLSAVSAEQELPLGDDAIEMVTGEEQSGQSTEVGPDDRTVDLTETRWEVRRGTSRRAARSTPTADADWMATQASERPARPAQPVEEQAEPRDEKPTTRTDEPSAEPAEEPGSGADAEPEEQESKEPAPKKTGKKGRRASVPSWDEIMFGGGRSD